MRLQNHRLGCWIFALCMAALFASCARTDPEKALRASVAGLQAAVGTRDTSAIEDVLAEDFVGPEGLDRQGARRMAQLMFLRHQQVAATLGPLDVTMQDEHATVRFTAALTGGAGGFLPDTGQVYDVQTGWRLQDGEWKLTSATWTPRIGN
ncbi:MAG: nuclear transport factor 2 family protein [Pseudomonadota bacterium]|nr:nuclear transport factor 2 family protein [Pseudomonadota bacterium]